MERDKAVDVMRTVLNAWNWSPPPETYSMWVDAMVEWSDAESAEVAVIELFKSLPHRPQLAELRTHYHAVRKRHADEDRRERGGQPKLEGVTVPSVLGDAWSPEGARFAAGLQAGAVFNGVLYSGSFVPLPSLTMAEVEAAELRSRETWEALGATREERVKAVVASFAGVPSEPSERPATLSDGASRVHVASNDSDATATPQMPEASLGL